MKHKIINTDVTRNNNKNNTNATIQNPEYENLNANAAKRNMEQLKMLSSSNSSYLGPYNFRKFLKSTKNLPTESLRKRKLIFESLYSA